MMLRPPRLRSCRVQTQGSRIVMPIRGQNLCGEVSQFSTRRVLDLASRINQPQRSLTYELLQLKNRKRCSEADAGPYCIKDSEGLGKLSEYGGLLMTCVGGVFFLIRAIESPGGDDDRQWLTFWMIFFFVSLLERYADVLLSQTPRYYECKLALFVWLMFAEGADKIYRVVRSGVKKVQWLLPQREQMSEAAYIRSLPKKMHRRAMDEGLGGSERGAAPASEAAAPHRVQLSAPVDQSTRNARRLLRTVVVVSFSSFRIFYSIFHLRRDIVTPLYYIYYDRSYRLCLEKYRIGIRSRRDSFNRQVALNTKANLLRRFSRLGKFCGSPGRFLTPRQQLTSHAEPREDCAAANTRGSA